MNKLFFFSSILPIFLLIFARDPSTLIYSLLVLLYQIKTRVSQVIKNIPLPSFLLLPLFIFVFGILTEWLSWLSNPQTNFLTHISSIYGFYIASAISWTLILHIFRFSLWQVFLVQGISGIFLEQQGIFFLKISENPAMILWWPYLLAVYGSYVGVGFLLVEQRLNMKSKINHWVKYPLALILIYLTLILFSLFD